MTVDAHERPMPDPDDIAAQSFTKVRKGFEVDEVRAYLVALAAQVREAQQAHADVSRRLAELERRGTDPRDLDETQVTQLLGEETARVLETARQAASDIRTRAEEQAAATVSAANEQAEQTRSAADEYAATVRTSADTYASGVRETADTEVAELRTTTEAELATMRHAAETVLAERTAEAEAAAAEIRAEVDAYAEKVRSEADAAAVQARADADEARATAERDVQDRLAAAERDADAMRAEAKEQGRSMVDEARTYRERVIADLADRRRLARTQLEGLAATRDALAVALTDVAGRIEASHRSLAEAVVDPRSLGDVATDRAALADDEDFAAAGTEGDEEAPAESIQPEQAAPDEAEPDEAEPEAQAEPDVVVEPEPEPEQATEGAVEPELDEEGDEDRAAAVFAKLKAETADSPEPGEGPDATAAEVAPAGSDAEAAEDEAPDGAGEATGDEALLERRDAATDELERQLARRLKRVLSDEQNEALDRLRRTKGTPAADEVLLAEGEHLGRYHAAALEDLVAAERSGASFFGEAPRRSADVGDVAEEFAAELVRQLRGRLEAAFDDGGDEAEISERIRACYREWKTQRIAETAAHYVLVAFNRGVAEAAVDGAGSRWLVDDGPTPCPDCDDNALAGTVPKGEPFPTGDLHPPAHPGCRCLAVPA